MSIWTSMPRRSAGGVQWNPDDTRLVAAEITYAEHAGPRWLVEGAFAAARPATSAPGETSLTG